MPLLLASLPDDVVRLILCYLEIQDLLTCAQVSRALQHVVQTDVSLQYKVELAIGGMVDGPPGGIPISERLRRLRACNQAWASGTHTWEAASYSDVWLPTCRRWGFRSSSDGSLSYLLQHDHGFELYVYSPPCPSAGRVSQQWKIPLGQLDEFDVSAVVDVAQDLIVLTNKESETWTTRLRLLSLANGGREHPSVSKAVLYSEPTDRTDGHQPGSDVFGLQVFGEYLAWAISPPGLPSSDLEIWNWKAGRRVWHRHFSRFIRFTFLDESYILTKDASFYQPVIRAYRFTPLPNDNAEPVDAPDDDPACSFWLHTAVTSGAGVYVTGLACRQSPPPAPGTPFRPDPALSIVSLYMYSRTANFQEASYVLLIPRATLRAHIDAAARGGPFALRSVQWEQWGSSGSLLLEVPAAPDRFETWARSLPYGARFTLAVQDTYRSEDVFVRTFDLNPWAAKYAARHGRVEDAGRGTAVTVGLGGEVDSEEEMPSELPYVAVRSQLKYAASPTVRVRLQPQDVPNEVVMHQDGFTILNISPPLTLRTCSVQIQ